MALSYGPMKPPVFNRVVRYFGSQIALAEAIGAKPQNVWHWQRRGIPAHQAAKIERVTRGKFKLRYLCPEVFAGLARNRRGR